MAEVISLIDGKTETIFNAYDFEDLIDKYMGLDARNYYRTLINELAELEDADEENYKLNDKVEELEEKIEDLQNNYTALEEEYEVYKQEHRE